MHTQQDWPNQVLALKAGMGMRLVEGSAQYAGTLGTLQASQTALQSALIVAFPKFRRLCSTCLSSHSQKHGRDDRTGSGSVEGFQTLVAGQRETMHYGNSAVLISRPCSDILQS